MSLATETLKEAGWESVLLAHCITGDEVYSEEPNIHGQVKSIGPSGVIVDGARWSSSRRVLRAPRKPKVYANNTVAWGSVHSKSDGRRIYEGVLIYRGIHVATFPWSTVIDYDNEMDGAETGRYPDDMVTIDRILANPNGSVYNEDEENN